MRSLLRSLASVLVGLLLALTVITLIEYLDFQVFPLPARVNFRDPQTIRAAVPLIPVPALLLVQLAWLLGTLAGCWLAARLADRSQFLHGITVGLCLFAAGIADMTAVPHPLWFMLMGLTVFPAGTFLGSRLAAARTPQG